MSMAVDRQEILSFWLQRDLTATAESGTLRAAVGRDNLLQQICTTLQNGRLPLLVGDPGVGKTSLVYELVRSQSARGQRNLFKGARVLQFSLQQGVSQVCKPGLSGRRFKQLIDALACPDDPIVPFFCDLDLADDLELRGVLAAAIYRLQHPIIAEGHPAKIHSLFEACSALEDRFTIIPVPEPTLNETRRILESWCEHQSLAGGRPWTSESLDEVLYLTNRFLAHSNMPRKTLDLANQIAATPDSSAPIETSEVVQQFCATYHVPRVLADPSGTLDLRGIADRFRARVLGQPQAVQSVINMISRIRAGLADVRRPFAALLFAGPSGVGKTHLAQLLAESLFGHRNRMIRVNMADYSGENSSQDLFGNPDEYRRPLIVGKLTQYISSHAFAVLLLDEFEKAHPAVIDRFLQLIDEGQFINAAGETVCCRSIIIIATSNAGAEVCRTSFGFARQEEASSIDDRMREAVRKHFRPELLNRFDEVVAFHPLSPEFVREIARRELLDLEERFGLRQRGMSISFDSNVIEWLTKQGFDPNYGARFLKRKIEQHVTTAISEYLLESRPPHGSSITLRLINNTISVAEAVHSPARPAPPARMLVPSA